jgi:hypothetical protein
MQQMDRRCYFLGNMHPGTVFEKVGVQGDEGILLVRCISPEIRLDQLVSEAVGEPFGRLDAAGRPFDARRR